MKPFSYGFSEQFDDSYVTSHDGSNSKLVPVQIKDSESLIILAQAILEGSNTSHPLRAIYRFMEDSAFRYQEDNTVNDEKKYDLENYNGKGVDTVAFKSCVKVGSSGVLKITGKTEEEIMQEFEKCYQTDDQG